MATNTTSFREGHRYEEAFIEHVRSMWSDIAIARSTPHDDMSQHFDVVLCFASRDEATPKGLRVDVKCAKRKSRGDAEASCTHTWIEVMPVAQNRKRISSVFGSADILAFYLPPLTTSSDVPPSEQWLWIPRKRLAKWVREQFASAIITSNREWACDDRDQRGAGGAPKLYSRKDRQDALAWVSIEEVLRPMAIPPLKVIAHLRRKWEARTGVLHPSSSVKEVKTSTAL